MAEPSPYQSQMAATLPEDQKLPAAPAAPWSPFSRRQRVAILVIVGLSGMLSPLSSLMYTPALPAIATSLGVSISDVNLTITTYLIFQGITPSIWGSLSDIYGRRLIYLVTLLITVGASIGLCLTESFPVVLVLRALHATGCSSTRALEAGVIRDITSPDIRGGYVGFYSAGVTAGTAFGPVFGGVIAQYTSWHGIFYFLLALGVLDFFVMLLFFPETLHSMSGDRKLPKYLQPPVPWLRITEDSLPAQQMVSKLKVDFLGPLRIMRDFDVICTLVFTGVCYTVWQDSMVATSTIYASQYHLSELEIGLTYMSNGVGSLVGNVVVGRILDYDYKKQALLSKAKGAETLVIEHARLRSLSYAVPAFTICMLLFGWIVQSHTHISASIVVAFFIGWLDSSILSTYSKFLVCSPSVY